MILSEEEIGNLRSYARYILSVAEGRVPDSQLNEARVMLRVSRDYLVHVRAKLLCMVPPKVGYGHEEWNGMINALDDVIVASQLLLATKFN